MNIPTIEEFLDDVIENNLFKDIKTIQKYTKFLEDKGDINGLVAYPIISAVTSGAELMGMLTTPCCCYVDSINRGPKKERHGFVYFCHNYMGQIYTEEKCDDIYKNIRNGIAHKYMINKPTIIYRFYKDRHLSSNESGMLIISADQFYDDFVNGYKSYRAKLAVDDNLRVIGNERMQDLVKDNSRYTT